MEKKSPQWKKRQLFYYFVHTYFYFQIYIIKHDFFFGFMRLMLSCVFLIALTTGMFQFRKDASSVCKEAPWFVYVDA